MTTASTQLVVITVYVEMDEHWLIAHIALVIYRKYQMSREII